MHTCICVRVCVCERVCARASLCTYIYTPVNIHKYTRKRTRAHVRMRARAQSHTHTHTHTHLCAHCWRLHHAAKHCNTLQHTATHTHMRAPPELRHIPPQHIHTHTHTQTLTHTPTHTHTFTHTHTHQHAPLEPGHVPCNTLSRSAHCNTLQHTATTAHAHAHTHTHTHSPACTARAEAHYPSTIKQISTLQHAATRYDTLQHTHTHAHTHTHTHTCVHRWSRGTSPLNTLSRTVSAISSALCPVTILSAPILIAPRSSAWVKRKQSIYFREKKNSQNIFHIMPSHDLTRIVSVPILVNSIALDVAGKKHNVSEKRPLCPVTFLLAPILVCCRRTSQKTDVCKNRPVAGRPRRRCSYPYCQCVWRSRSMCQKRPIHI